MKLKIKPLAIMVVIMAAVASINAPGVVADDALVEKGQKIALDRKKGNCLACHIMPGGTLMGNIGPPLVGIKARFPDKKELRKMIWDMTAYKPHVMMPVFGKYRILTESEIDAVTEYIHTL